MKLLDKLILLISFSIILSVSAQQTPAPIQKEAITIIGATAHIGNGKVIKNSIIIFENGKITTITTTNENIVKKGTIINATGKHVYPGFIVPNSTLGLIEIDALRPTKDADELGDLIPNMRSLIAYNPESRVVETMRPNGVLIAQITPRGGTISGTSSIVQLDAWNWEDAAIKVDDGIHLNWPNSYQQGRWWKGESSAYKTNNNYKQRVESIKNYIENSKAYGLTIPKTQSEDYNAMQGLFSGTKKLYLHANGEKEIIDAITILKEIGISQIVIVGGYDAYKIPDFLVKNNVPVIIKRVHSTPQYEDEDYDLPYKLAKTLTDNGVLVALQTSGDMERMNTRNLPFYAGQLVGQGMNKEQALQLITSNAAKILGIEANYGSLEVGKSATLFISEGDALDMRTNILTKAYIDGRDISLETHQTKLWERYSKKYNN